VIPGIDVSKTLREIADKIDSGEYKVEAFDFNYPPTFDHKKMQWLPNFKMMVL